MLSAPHPWIQIPSHIVKFRSRVQGHAQGIPCRAAEAPSCTHTEDALNSSSNALSSLLSACKTVGHSAVSPLKTRPQKVMENKHECVVECKKKKKRKKIKCYYMVYNMQLLFQLSGALYFHIARIHQTLVNPALFARRTTSYVTGF